MRLLNYLTTSEEVNNMVDLHLFKPTSPIPDSIKCDTTIEAKTSVRLDLTGIIGTYPDNRCPRYQDLIPIYDCPWYHVLLGSGEAGELKGFADSPIGEGVYNTIKWDFGTAPGMVSFTASTVFNDGANAPKVEFIYNGVLIHTINNITNGQYAFNFPYTAIDGQFVMIRLSAPGNLVGEQCGMNFNVDGCATQFNSCATCNLVLNGLIQNQLSVISAGLLTSATCTVGNYAIDWRLGGITGPIAFTSGTSVAYDPAITILHPFSNEPSSGGIYYPVIKSVILNGVEYTAYIEPYTNYSPDLATCQPNLTVQNYTCANGGAGTYAHTINYTNAVTSPTLATRILRFDLDAATLYFAWNFTGNEVPDIMRLTYVSPANSTETVEEYWNIGSQNLANNYSVVPKIYDGPFSIAQLKAVIPLAPNHVFAAGDYMRVEITPNAANANTNWSIAFKCITTVLNCPTCSKTLRLMDWVNNTFTFNAAQCRWECTIPRLFPCDAFVGNIFDDYHSMSEYNGNSIVGTSSISPNVSIALLDLTSAARNANKTVLPSSLCKPATGTVTLTKTGNEIKLSFTSSVDYNEAKSELAIAMAHEHYTGWVNDPTNLNYYRNIDFGWRKANSCGDTFTTKFYNFNRDSPPILNDGLLTITLNLLAVTNGLTDIDPCNNIYESLDIYISSINDQIAQANFSETTSVAINTESGSMFSSVKFVVNIFEQTEVTGTNAIGISYVRPDMCPDICPSSTTQQESVLGYINNNNYMPWFNFLFTVAIYVKILDIGDPANNYEIREFINTNGTFIAAPASNYILRYRKEGGVQTFPV